MTVVEPVKIAAADVSPNRNHGGDLRVLISPRTVGAEKGLFGVLTLRPGERIREHYHPYSEEALYVVSGEVEVRLDDEPVPASAGDAVLIRRTVRHSVQVTGSDTAFLVFAHAGLAPDPKLGHVVTEEDESR
ncbi:MULTISPECIES: cupin domain-containing protein [Micromonospora]|uniref:cupin domain-containing protein n=1 Tax=Micromonospora TaxID=1873 RepID=UPI00340E2E28